MKPHGAGRAATALREKRTRERVGGDRCLICGEREFPALIKARRSLLEEHHIVGRNHDAEDTAPVCRNCHAKLHEGYLQAGVDLREAVSPLDHLKAALMARAEFLGRLSDGFYTDVERLCREVGE